MFKRDLFIKATRAKTEDEKWNLLKLC
jgi:hypothetical protein